jgi:SAM-dependent methyltransferase
MELFQETFRELEPDMRALVAEVQRVPLEARPGTLHIDRLEGLVQYAFYVSVVREWLRDATTAILDWGGQHGQVTRLLSRYYPNTVCYALAGDEYDRQYGLADWHRRLGISRVARGRDPSRIEVARTFGAVVSSGVLEHVGECGVTERTSLAEVHRVLEPGGLFFIWNLPRRFGREFVYPLLGRETHARRYRRAEIVRLLVESGFEPLHVSTHELLPLGVLKRLGGLARPDILLRWDYRLAERLPLLAQNFTIVARRLGTVAPDRP